MKRYRVTQASFDSRSLILETEIQDTWEPSTKTLWASNKHIVLNEYIAEFGAHNFSQKEADIKAIGVMPMSIIFFHNDFLRQCRNSFIQGSYYPAFTGITALTERILNHLIFTLREEFPGSKKYKKISTATSITNWNVLIHTLDSWNILQPNSQELLFKLKDLRHNYALHFNPETETRSRELALNAIKAFQEFIKLQFPVIGKQPWFIEGTRGSFYIKKEYETHPFVKHIYLPNCLYVGPNYEMYYENEKWGVRDEEYENIEISDEVFKKLIHKSRGE